ncbi:MAG: DEAD/DEAH box helicase [Deltaproteobacteria bacterium]|nr:DEAD/DEAH box helicase [Deltaproteobacteria bacterium]MBW1931047.1 DEAD/DEAH box helicase [Deltaproteobacteria bacterium]
MAGLNVGSIVRCRNREWVILPSPDDDLFLLRPLTGGEAEICGIYRQFSNLGFDRIEPATFPLPKPEDTSDAVGSELLWNAARLSLRDGAGPFRSIGRISVRPRPYQFVPLMMALRLQPIRLLIADDVGIGKTIEALLIARELLDRGEVRRVCVLCPPYLCDQWEKELREKFHIDAVVIRSGTVTQLERNLPSGDHSIFGYYPHIVVSIDYAKSEKHRANFLIHCPELVIVDEVHGASQPAKQARAQQQRHELLQEIAKDSARNLILLTATPHSGVETSFLSLLSLLRPEFANLNLQKLSQDERDQLARHFIQRRRADVKNWLGEKTPFPERIADEKTYGLSEKYRKLFDQVYGFSRELVKAGESLSGWKRRIRYWTALALLRCVMSSPAAALAALEKRIKGLPMEEMASDESYSPYIYESSEEEAIDVQPTHIVEEGKKDLSKTEARRLREFARLAEQLKGKDSDQKVMECTRIVAELLQEGYKPIVWCRYIATSDYVAETLTRRLRKAFSDLRVISVTGALSEEERRMRVEELSRHSNRVLVATDCLSEGINLQDWFTAVVHYDLPWNPNRLEQREGRVDRFGQCAPKVKAILFYGHDNIIDGVVLDVLLRKAREIRRTLGITVPVPMDSDTVMEAVLKTLFFRGREDQQLSLFDDLIVQEARKSWDEAASREKESRTRFAQRTIKPDEVDRELKMTDKVLGDPEAVKDFVLNACQRLGLDVSPNHDGIYTIASLERLPDLVRISTPDQGQWIVTFSTPAPENVTYLGRNHPFVSSLAQYLLEEAMTKGKEARAARCGVIRTFKVERRTVLLLLRVRFTVEEPGKTPLMAEEILVRGFTGFPPDRINWIPEEQALALLKTAKADAQITPQERREVIEEVLGWWGNLDADLNSIVKEQAKRLEDAHRRVRSAVRLPRRGMAVKPHLPPDLIGILVLMPVPKGVAK